MYAIQIITIVFLLNAIYWCYIDHKKGKMSAKSFKIVVVCEIFAILGIIFLIISE